MNLSLSALDVANYCWTQFCAAGQRGEKLSGVQEELLGNVQSATTVVDEDIRVLNWAVDDMLTGAAILKVWWTGDEP